MINVEACAARSPMVNTTLIWNLDTARIFKTRKHEDVMRGKEQGQQMNKIGFKPEVDSDES